MILLALEFSSEQRSVALARDGEVLAAAVETVIARRTGLRVTTKATAERYGCALTATRAEITRVQALLRHAPAAGW